MELERNNMIELFSAEDIIQHINKARIRFSEGKLNKEVFECTIPEFWMFPENTADIKKKQLLQMAEKKLPKPSYRNHPLGRALNTYTNKSWNTYDPEFTKKIKTLRPEWFQDQTKKRKNKLLMLAKSGASRPNQKRHPLGYNLSSYTSIKSTCYDKEFTNQLKLLAPHWFKK